MPPLPGRQVLGLRAVVNHLDRLLERQSPGGKRRGNFADRVPDDSVGPDAVVLVEFHQRDLDRHDRGLDNDRVVDPGLAFFLAQLPPAATSRRGS